tara:strand:- start:741 stop:1475 length:735 start_codon:yes stop_codon:yes gene_type:complete
MKKIFIITPVWKRCKITKIIFYNFYRIKNSLEGHIDLNFVVIGDDANLDIAKEYNFFTLKQNNDYLGRKFNDGFEFSIKNGADAVVPVGSDSLITDSIIKSGSLLSSRGNIVFSTKHSLLNETGKKIGCINTASLNKNQNKGALWFYGRKLLSKVNGRPCDDFKKSSCDRSTIENLIKANKNIVFKENNQSYYEHLAIKNKKVQIWKYNDYIRQFVKEDSDVSKIIKRHYGTTVLNRVNKYHGR